MPKHCIVIGAGIIGASIAYHLAKAGARVTVLDEAEPGGVATRASWAWINASWGNPRDYFHLRTRSMREWKRLGDEIPGLKVDWCGALCWDIAGEAREAFIRDHSSWGYGMRVVSRDEALAIEPNLADPPESAIHVAEEGVTEPLPAAQALLSAARDLSAEVFAPTRVRWLDVEAGEVRGVFTEEGSIRGDEVILAAGAATPELAASAEVAIPLDTPAGLLVHSKPAPKLLHGLVIAPEAHIRQTPEGRLVAGSDFGGTDPGADPQATAKELFAKVQKMLKGGDALELDFHTIGYRPTPKDGFPIIGRPAAPAKLYIAVMHSGMTNAAAVGRFAADEILTDASEPLLAPYRPDRFASA